MTVDFFEKVSGLGFSSTNIDNFCIIKKQYLTIQVSVMFYYLSLTGIAPQPPLDDRAYLRQLVAPMLDPPQLALPVR